MTLKAFKYRLYPTESQSIKINKTIGCTRLIYNLMLNAKQKHYEQYKKTLNITPAKFKQDDKYSFLKEVDSLALANAQLNLNTAYNNFFENPECFELPTFKSKHKSRWSYTTNNQNGTIRFDKNRIKLPKVGYVKLKEHRPHEGKIKSATISKEKSGEYYISVLCEVEEIQKLPETNRCVGIDLGLKDFIICSDGTRIEAPKYFRKSEEKLAKKQRQFDKTQKGSKGHEKLRIKVAKCYQKIKNQRNDFLQKLSTKLIKENQIICLEDLSVKGMEQNHKLAKSVTDASFSSFVSMLEYKAEWYGRKIIKIDRFYPSTQICSSCGYKNESIKGLRGLKVREWICPICGEVHDRDLNASRNILKEGLRIINKELNPRNVEDSRLTDQFSCIESSMTKTDLASEATRL